MTTTTVEITTPDGVADAYLARPDDDVPGQGRGVLFIMDAGGLRPRIKEMADRIAARGFVVLAPNVFYRAGRAPVVPLYDFSDPENRSRLIQAIRPFLDELTPERLAADGEAYLNYLIELAPGPITITGYCLGGRVGWRIAAAHPDRVTAFASFHGGGLVTDAPDSPHRSADKLKAELYFGHADNDPSMNAEQIATLEAALDDVSVQYRSEVYEGARHGYTMSDTPAYSEPACERHFAELFSLLERAAAK